MTTEKLLEIIKKAAKDKVTELYLRGRKLTSLPPEIGQLTALTTLNLSGNQLTSLPPEIGQLTGLKSLNLFENKLMSLPPEIGQLAGLKLLGLYSNQLMSLPPEIGQLTSLTLLGLSRNQLVSLPPEIDQLTSLKSLNLFENKLTSLPSGIDQLTALIELYLSTNQLTSLPPEIGQLTTLRELYLSTNQLTSLPPEIGQLAALKELDLSGNQLTSLPPEIGQLTTLRELYISGNQLASLPPEIGQLTTLRELYISSNQLTSLPPEIGQLTTLTTLNFYGNKLMSLPPEIGQLKALTKLGLKGNKLISLPPEIGQLTALTELNFYGNKLTSLPPEIGQLTALTELNFYGNQLTSLPPEIGQLTALTELNFYGNKLMSLSPEIGQLTALTTLNLYGNQLTSLPPEIGQLTNLITLDLYENPLEPALLSAFEGELDEVREYLNSLKDKVKREELYEAKLILIGEGKVGKTTLLKALTDKEPKKDELTTIGVNIDVQSLCLPHPDKNHIDIYFNAWDFGGQDTYRITHQFFFSSQAVYLLVWEPRIGVKQCQIEDWLKMIRLRVGEGARVIIISTYSQSEHIAQIDKSVLSRHYGALIVDFHEVDSLVDDPKTGEKVGVAELKIKIAQAAKGLEQMGMDFNRDWREARDELVLSDQPHITYDKFAQICHHHGLNPTAAKILARLMNTLGYIVYYGEDEQLKHDVILKPEWMTKAIGLILADKKIQSMQGILPDTRLKEVWHDHSFEKEPRFAPAFYSFFLRLMEKYDVSYRLENEDASLVAQHVPQAQPVLPWQPEEDIAEGRRRISMVCVMDDVPHGLVPWMIVRTHDYEHQYPDLDGKPRRLHWQKGMFLKRKNHGESMLELRDREFHFNTEAVWPRYFMRVLEKTLLKLIKDNWPGMKDHYVLTVPCKERQNGNACRGRFDIDSLRQFLEEGDKTYRCQVCRKRQNILELLYGFVEEDTRKQLIQIESKLDRNYEETLLGFKGLESRLANYVMAIMHAIANESKDGPRLFTVEPIDGNWKKMISNKYRLHLWCEAEGCQHPVHEIGKGVYKFEVTKDWVKKIAPYANFVAGMLKTILPMAAPGVNVLFGDGTIDEAGVKNHLKLMKEATGKLLTGEFEIKDSMKSGSEIITDMERSGILELHSFLRKEDPHHENLGLKRIDTYTGDYLWLCEKHYKQAQS